ncbi:cysteine-rich receptor-like protein kinase 29 [Tripterygium wilfordii]|uniref:cysteine-rich receptor-like protein kinase 29 n=1 Tax=Tripterygium wilfordii TaxID=458696 RepID=UPI0018F81B2D|nr:cysteine-rich receptor-like protein kinase 29 [Tripterygium wilfordii]
MGFSGPHFGILILMYFIFFRITEADLLLRYFCLDEGNYTANSTYQANLDRVLSSFPNAENDYGFYNMSAGNDVKPNDCLSCISDATIELKTRCPGQKEAIIWFDYCMFRYSHRSIFGIMETSNTFYMRNNNNVLQEVDGFNRALSGLLTSLRIIAASGDSFRKFAAANATGPDFPTIYALVQCTPDLSESDCNYCLVRNFGDIPHCCQGKMGGRVVGPSCNFRFELGCFYDPSVSTPVASPPPPPAIPASPPPPSEGNSTTSEGKGSASNNTVIIIVISTTIPAILIICVCICIFLRGRKLKKKLESADEAVSEIGSADSLQYGFGTIRVATNNFSNANKLGQGGFGAVYKGTFPNGQEVAVKRLSKESSQGEVEFKNEILLLAKLQHRNLVRLMGFCYEREERVLIYEFMPNSSLSNFLSDYTKRAQLDWENRYNIIYGIARGLTYLLEESQHRIIHRDLKTSNILLDSGMNAKISDFGMAKLFATDQTRENMSKIVGT